MHKGYAFVQFANPFDARSACLGEDGRTISGQVVGKQARAHRGLSKQSSLSFAVCCLISDFAVETIGLLAATKLRTE